MSLARGVVVSVVTLSVSQADVLPKAGHGSVCSWANKQVIMIGHQTIGKQIDLELVERLIENLLEGFEVGWLVEDRGSEVGTVEHVVAMASGIGPFGSSHISSLAQYRASRTHQRRSIPPLILQVKNVSV